MNPADKYTQLKAAVLGAQQAGGISPLGDFPEIQKLYSTEQALAPKQQAVAGDIYNTGVTVANQKAEQEAALRQKLQEIKDMSDPNKYQQVPKKDGGYSFLDPSGKEISAFEYSRITGQSPDKILAQSQNPIDISFVQDYQNLQDFMKAIANNDTETVDAVIDSNNELEKYRDNIPKLMKRFYQAYPTVFGVGGFQGAGTAGQKAGTVFVPSANSIL